MVIIGCAGFLFLNQSKKAHKEEADEVLSATSNMKTETVNTDTYDLSAWDYRFPEKPQSVYQDYFVIFNEGTRDNRIEMSVFDIDDELEEKYLYWNGYGEPVELNYNDSIKNCDQYYYDMGSNSWTLFVEDYWRITDSANNIISSNIDVCDSDGYSVLEHITSEGSENYIDYSYHETAEYDESEGGIHSYDYVLQQSSRKYLTESDVQGMSIQQLNYAKNEIYARHGRRFDSPELQNFFNGKSWYIGKYAPADFDKNYSDSLLSDVEKNNAQFLKEMEYRLAPSGYQLDQ